ncbi:MAG: hypothetical protein HY905_14440 [Deltaproteobacteria bacterium]|nr:hypothetical protein [Deltaproteobacteria bacterium]
MKNTSRCGILGAAIWLAAGLVPACGDSGGGNDASDAEIAPEVEGSADADVDVEPETEVGPDADADGGADADADGDADADDGGPSGLPVGSPCTFGEECLDGTAAGECVRALIGLTFPDGYCTALGCTDDADCPGGATDAACVPAIGFRWCAHRCDTAAPDCRTGYVCVDPDAIGPVPALCLPVCRTDDDCPTGQTCDTTASPPICRETAGADNGSACAGSAECAVGSSCVPENSSFVGVFPASGPPGGICIQDCLTDSECTNGGSCVVVCADQNSTPGADDCDDDGTAGLDPGASGICLEACDLTDPAACARTGYACRSIGENLSGPRDVCTVDCAEGGCTIPGWECDPSAGMGSLEYGAGRCQPPFEDADLGQACTFTSGCTGGTCLAEPYLGAPGGTCIEECLGGLSSTDPCPTGSYCLARAGEIGSCVPRCTPGGTDCRDGWACTRVVIVDVCMPACTSNDQCDNGCCRADGSGTCNPAGTDCL